MAMRLDSEADAYELFEQLRWGGRPDECPHCGAARAFYFLEPRGHGRRTRTGRLTARRVWRCGSCRRQFSVLTGTVFEGSRIPLVTWAAVVADLTRATGPLSAADVVERYGVTAQTARHMLARLRAGGLTQQ